MKDCPVCSIPMDEVPKSGILIDVCPRCKGVWLDRGELARLLETMRGHKQEYDEIYEKHYSKDKEHHYNHDKDYNKYKHHKKKKSIFNLLEDIFD